MKFVYNDGGREDARYKGDTGDCVVRSIAIATGAPYREVYDALYDLQREHYQTSRARYAKAIREKGTVSQKASPRNGVLKPVWKAYMETLGQWVWIPTMSIGSGCKTHLRSDELPSQGALIVSVSKHMTAVVDGELHDTYDCSRDGTRCVYGFYIHRSNLTNEITERWPASVRKTRSERISEGVNHG